MRWIMTILVVCGIMAPITLAANDDEPTGSAEPAQEESAPAMEPAAPAAEPAASEPVKEEAPLEGSAKELKQTVEAPAPAAAEAVEADPIKQPVNGGLKIGDGKVIKFFELYGYFSANHLFTYNLFMNGNNPYLPTTPYANEKERGEDVLSWGQLRLHLEPIINVAETMSIHSKLTLLGSRLVGTDNTVPDAPEHALLPGTQTTVDPSVRVEGLWGVLDTPIGELRVGRMPFHWGLGILYNDANTVDTFTSGDYLDRVMFIIPVMGIKIIPAFDYISEGAMVRYNDHFIDASSRDDGWQVALMLTMQEDDPAVLKEKLLKEATVYEFGFLGMYSWKSDASTETIITVPPAAYTLSEQDARLFTMDLWGTLYYKNFSIKGEIAYLDGKLGRFESDTASGRISARMFGAALEAQWQYIPRKLHFTLLSGAATGDSAAGVQGDAVNLPGKAIDAALGLDTKVENFRFNTNYNFNSFVWREALGRFTSGYYVSLDTRYYFRDDISMRGGLTYSGAWSAKQTPGSKGAPLALEPFVGAYYDGESGLRGGLTFQLAVPFDGLNTEENNAKLFFGIHTYLGFVF